MDKIAKYFGIIGMFSLFSCSAADEEQLSIGFSADSSKIVVSNIAPGGLLQLRDHLATDSSYQKLVSVLQTPTEDDSLSMEVDWPGKLMLDKNQLVFVPDRPFVKGKQYLVLTVINSKFATKKEILTSDVGHRLKANQQVLVR